MKKIVYIVLFLAIILFSIFHDNLLISVESEQNAAIILGSIILGIYIYDSYKVITKREYTTSLFIIISNMVAIITVVGVFYLAFKTENETNIKIVHLTNTYLFKLEILFVIASAFSKFLKDKKFIKVEKMNI